MSKYTPPLRDMSFVLNELATLDEIAALPGFEDATPELVEAVLEEAGKLAAEVLAPLNQSGDRTGSRLADAAVHTPAGWKAAYRTFIEGGWNGLAQPTEYGGQGLPALVAAAVQEMWHGANLSFALCPMLTQAAIDAITRHGTPAQQALFVPRLVAGTWTGTMNLTEPQAGSDLSAVRTKAVPQGDHYLLTGQKIFITYGDHDLAENIVHMVLARTPNAPEGVKGISMFIVPKQRIDADGSVEGPNEVRCISLEHKLGIHASPTAAIAFGEAQGALGYLVGEENRGLEYMFTMMNLARLAVGFEGLGIAERAYQQARDYARERVQGRPIGARTGGAIIQHPDVRRMLLTMKSQIEAMRGLAYFAAAAMDTAQRHPEQTERRHAQALVELLTPVVKGWCTEVGLEIATLGIQVHGGMGYIEETGAAQHWRDARITTIYEGTTGIQANDLVGRKLVREEGTTAKTLIETMRATDAELADAPGGSLDDLRAALTHGIDALAQATDWILQAHREDPRLPAAASVPYLRLWGTVTGGWQMARAAAVAQRKLDTGEGDPGFYQAKLVTARFYAQHILAQADGLLHTITQGSSVTLDLREEQF